MNAEVQWKEGMRFDAVSDSKHHISMDSGPGAASAPTPMEYVLMSLCGCTAMDVISIVQKMRRTVVRFSVKAHGFRAETHPKKFIGANIVYEITSPDLTDEELRRAVELSQEKYCSVSAMFTGSGAPLTWSAIISRA